MPKHEKEHPYLQKKSRIKLLAIAKTSSWHSESEELIGKEYIAWHYHPLTSSNKSPWNELEIIPTEDQPYNYYIGRCKFKILERIL